MEVKINNIKKIISQPEITFIIPPYQRSYSWKHQNCRQWIDDILSIAKDGNQTHFVGNIYQKMNGKYKIILIDGNQRLTTTMLMLKALYNICDDEKLKRKIKNQSLINEYGEDSSFHKLIPIKKDSNIFFKIIESDTFNVDDFSINERNNNVYKNYLYIEKYLKEKISSGYTVNEIYKSIDRLDVAEGILGLNEDEQIVFKGLNGTGLELTDIDLLKNRLFLKLNFKDQEYLYENFWIKIEEFVGEDNLEQFLVFYLMMKRKTASIVIDGKISAISSKNISLVLEKVVPSIYNGDKDKVEDCLKDILRFAKYYRNCLFKEKNNFSSHLEKKLYELFFIMGEKDASILVMYFYSLYDDNKIDLVLFEKLIDICLTISVRTNVCDKIGLHRRVILPMLQKLVKITNYKNFEKEFWKIITQGDTSFVLPRDSEFFECLTTKDLYNGLKSKKCKYLLYMIEGHSNPKELPEYELSSIEHICPRTLSNGWKDYLNIFKDLMYYPTYVNSLGNLTLTGYNSELSNKLFKDKKVEYAKSNYTITRNIADNKEWTSKEISERAKKLADKAIKIWDIPNEYNKNILIDNGVVYDLNCDFESFKGTKPFSVSIGGKRLEISSWRDLLAEIIKFLYNEDADIFLELIDYDGFPGNKKLLSLKEEEGFVEPVSGIFLNPCKKIENVLKITKCMIEYFDKNTGSDYLNSFEFTIRC